MNNQSGKFAAGDKPAGNGNGTGNGTNGSVPKNYVESPMVRMPFGLFILGKDQESDGKKFDGQVSIKYGPEKGDWLKMSYIEMKKLIDFCKEHREQFNEMLAKERALQNTGDL